MLRRARFRLLSQGGGPACLEALGSRLALLQQAWYQESAGAMTAEGLAAPAPVQQGWMHSDEGPWPAVAPMPLIAMAGGGSSSSSSSSRSSSRASTSGGGGAWGSDRQLHALRPSQQRSCASSSHSGGRSSSAENSGGEAEEDVDPVTLAAALAVLASQCGCSDVAALIEAVEKLNEVGLAKHGLDVAAWLHKQGVGHEQLGRLVLRCPYLFSFKVDQRAQVLFGQLQQLGLTAAEAARCFKQQPTAAHSPSFGPAIVVLAHLFAAGSKSTAPAAQLLGSFLCGQPAAVKLLAADVQTLQQRIDTLLGWGLSKAQLVAAAQRSWPLLDAAPARLAALAAELQQELGGGRKLLAKLLHRAPRLASCSLGTVRGRVQALAKVFGQEQALHMLDVAPILLTVDSRVWQTALAVMELCGLAQDTILLVVQSNPAMLDVIWLEPRRLASRLLLERCLQLTAGQVYERHAGYVAKTGTERVAVRLLFLQKNNLLPWLVAEKEELLKDWRRQRGFRAARPAPGEPPLISLRDVGKRTDAQFASLPAVQAAGGLPALQAFQAGLATKPDYRALQAEAEAEAAQLMAQLPEELQHAAVNSTCDGAAAAEEDAPGS